MQKLEYPHRDKLYLGDNIGAGDHEKEGRHTLEQCDDWDDKAAQCRDASGTLLRSG